MPHLWQGRCARPGAGLATAGLTEILRIYHLDRGYDDLVGKLQGVGARIAREIETALQVRLAANP